MEKKETRNATSWKKRYLELEKKYNKLLEDKLLSNSRDTDETQTTKKEVAEAPKEEAKAPLPTSEIKSKAIIEEEKSDDATGEVKSPVEETSAKPEEKEVKETGANPNDTPEETSLEIEVEEDDEVNPDDYDYCCSNCKELFNEKGNKTDEGIKCPSCGEVF